MKKALITGITGQTGSYLAALLLKKNYIVYGIKRRTSSVYNTARLEELISFKEYYNKKLFILYGDVTDYSNLHNIIKKIQPDVDLTFFPNNGSDRISIPIGVSFFWPDI